jgi:hypothetical protein
MQTRMDSLMEAVVNILIGLSISTVANLVLLEIILGFPMSFAVNALISSVFTVISLIRSYTIRRAFNGRSVWSAIKDKFNARYNHRLLQGEVAPDPARLAGPIGDVRLGANDPAFRSSADYFYWR